MSFDNFYEESDKTGRKRWKILGLVILAIFGWLCMALFIATRPPKSPEEIEKIIAGSKTLTRIDRLCNEIPKPEKFEFSYKKLSGNSQRAAISYRFKTDRPNDEIEIFFRLMLTSNGWVEEKSDFRRFKNENQTIALERVGFPNADWSINCAEENK